MPAITVCHNNSLQFIGGEKPGLDAFLRQNRHLCDMGQFTAAEAMLFPLQPCRERTFFFKPALTRSALQRRLAVVARE